MSNRTMYGTSTFLRRILASNSRGSVTSETLVALALVGLAGAGGMVGLGGGMEEAIAGRGQVSHARGMAVSTQAGVDAVRAAELAVEASARAGTAAGSAGGTAVRGIGALENLSGTGTGAVARASTTGSSGVASRTQAMERLLEGLWSKDVNVTRREFMAATAGLSVAEAHAFWESAGAKVFVSARKDGTSLQEALARASDANYSAQRAARPSARLGTALLRGAQRTGAYTESWSVVADAALSRVLAKVRATLLHGSQTVGVGIDTAFANPGRVGREVARGFARDLGVAIDPVDVAHARTQPLVLKR